MERRVEIRLQKLAARHVHFHCDNSNPEFQPIAQTGAKPAMVLDSLDAQRKPVWNPQPDSVAKLVRNRNIGKWFRPWRIDDTVPTYTYADTIISFSYDTAWNLVYDTTTFEAQELTGDTLMKNVPFDDSLEFVFGNDTSFFLVPNPLGGMRRDTSIIPDAWTRKSANFFPLDSMGFHAGDTAPNNNSFSMEMHNSFVFRPGQVWRIGSDDDSWTFFGGRLAMDLGGFRPVKDTTLRLDSLGWLTPGDTFDIDVFWADRMKTGAALNIITNIGFLEGVEGTKVVERVGVLRPRTPDCRQTRMSFDRGVLRIPAGRHAVRVTVLDARGRSVAMSGVRGKTALAVTPYLQALPAGIYLVRAELVGADGTVRG